MSAEIKRCYRFYTLTDYEQEEKWLREMANQGWMLKSMKLIVYTFEKIEPQDIVFKLDFQNTRYQPDDAYMTMLEDYGWTYLTSCNNFRYLYKAASETSDSNEIYTDNASNLAMLKRIMRYRFLPIICVFLCCVIPMFLRVTEQGSTAMEIFWTAIMLLYIFVFIKVLLGYSRLYRKFQEK